MTPRGEPYDVLLVGGGLLGLATAARLLARRPSLRLALLEKEPRVAAHQSGRNSGVLHSGLYYRPGSLKARHARLGRRAMERFCLRQGIPFERCGKLVVACDPAELERLDRLHARALANRVRCRRLGPEEIAEREPHARGAGALWIADTGIVDFGRVAERLAELLGEAGCDLRLGTRVIGLGERSDGWVAETTAGDFEGRALVNCGGLESDRLLASCGRRPPVRIVPFRGDFHELVPERRHLCRGLIYPVPDPRLPFLGPHFTRKLDGRVECGPNAVLSLAREGYHRHAFRWRDARETLAWPGTWRVALRHGRAGLGEAWRSWSRRAFARALARLVPEVRARDLRPCRAGIRAQAVARDGTLADDFVLVETERAVHLLNAPSPAATAALALGDHLAFRLLARWGAPPRPARTGTAPGNRGLRCETPPAE